MKNSNRFEFVQTERIGRNLFDLSYDHKLSFKIGELIPTAWYEVLPGDIFRCGAEALLRLPTLLFPVMDGLEICQDWHYVPLRVLDPTWPDWWTGKITTTWPNANGLNTLSEGDLGDYLGIPVGNLGSAAAGVNVWTAAAYAKIYDDYYLDQNVGTEQFSTVVAGTNATYSTLLNNPPLKVNLKHDYFTSALPSTQFGSAVTLPLVSNDDAMVTLDAASEGTQQKIVEYDDHSTSYNNETLGTTPAGGFMEVTSAGHVVVLDPNGTLVVDFTGEATDIITVRRAFKLQEFLEKLMRVGRRSQEALKGIWDEFAGDARLDRAEMFGYNKSYVSISEVLNTAEGKTYGSDTVDLPVGTLHGHGIGMLSGGGHTIKCPEHGILMCLTFVRPVTNTYQDGLPKAYRRLDYLDYAIPQLAHIGEQQISEYEIYGSLSGSTFNDAWAYQERYAEYKSKPSQVSAQYRSTLNYAHLGFDFSSLPGFNQTFIQCDSADYDKIFAVSGQPQIYGQIRNKVTVLRKLPKFSTPKL